MKNHGAKEALRLKYRRRYANRDGDAVHAEIDRDRIINAFYRRQRNGARAALSMGKLNDQDADL